MPIIRIEEGDLLKKFTAQKFQGIAHGCNCMHTMGAGIAGQIAKKFNQALLVDQTTPPSIAKLGTWSEVAVHPFGHIFNLYTQRRPGLEHPVVLYAGIQAAFNALNMRAKELSWPDRGFILGVPMIGCGIAGGNWDVVKDIIEQHSSNMQVVVVEYKPS